MKERRRPELHGLLAEFDSAAALKGAARHVRERGYTKAEAYAPFPIEGLDEMLGGTRGWIAPITLLGGLLGGAGGYFLQYYSAVIDYPVDIGGRGLHSWPAFIPATFEMTVLGAAVAAVVAMLALNGLPKLYHPLFEVEEFESATRNRFFLFLPACDPVFAPGPARRLLDEVRPILLKEVKA
jgi:hypothetical protein